MFFIVSDRVLLCSPGWPRTSYPPASTSEVLGFQVDTTIPSSIKTVWKTYKQKKTCTKENKKIKIIHLSWQEQALKRTLLNPGRALKLSLATLTAGVAVLTKNIAMATYRVDTQLLSNQVTETGRVQVTATPNYTSRREAPYFPHHLSQNIHQEEQFQTALEKDPQPFLFTGTFIEKYMIWSQMQIHWSLKYSGSKEQRHSGLSCKSLASTVLQHLLRYSKGFSTNLITGQFPPLQPPGFPLSIATCTINVTQNSALGTASAGCRCVANTEISRQIVQKHDGQGTVISC